MRLDVPDDEDLEPLEYTLCYACYQQLMTGFMKLAKPTSTKSYGLFNEKMRAFLTDETSA